ncbi:MAG: alpha/beta hydrolase [Bacteroidetes bacterium]|nr:alpha/beta hydrolase [Bacteroidota bacterium]
MQSAFLTYKSSRIHYQKAGNGKRALVALHGYSDSANSFDLIKDYMGNDFTLIAIDLPFHGQTDWKEGLTLHPAELIEIIDSIISENSLPHSKIHLMGFSMGGRIALSLFQNVPGKIDKLILLASDGLHISKWYWLATQTWMGNALFNFTTKYPGWFFNMLHVGRKMKLIKQNVYKFSMSSMKEKQLRHDLYARWTAMRKFTTNFKKLKSLVLLHKTPVRLVYGEYDHIIRTNGGEKFREGIEKYCELSILSCGHHVLVSKNLETIVRLIRE